MTQRQAICPSTKLRASSLPRRQMPAHPSADGRHDPCRLPRLEDGHHLIVPGPLEVGSDKVIASALGRLEDGCTPLLRAVFHPVMELVADLAQQVARDAHPWR